MSLITGCLVAKVSRPNGDFNLRKCTQCVVVCVIRSERCASNLSNASASEISRSQQTIIEKSLTDLAWIRLSAAWQGFNLKDM